MLILEMPPYKRPLLRVVVRHMWDRSKLFLRRAGTVILGINILLWFLATYPHNRAIEQEFSAKRAAIVSAQSKPTPGEAAVQPQDTRAELAALDREECRSKTAAELRRTTGAVHRTSHCSSRLRLEDGNRHCLLVRRA